ncbi:RNA pseudouridine synthase [Acanthamoeba castellanii str. Neff]|uniref:RNA pseudouridine synthase n=1 Tax=Acanthamoeba castellanii (strain ATCC 30010 / Neff) TaxID=1257118 RepID=L8GIN1_ACACF|nr:RNA pseudouridine synthase [Acanthamoeba castellanii str. Neff]ELR12704.1 RNA pseudouridine synthase [Acanthamoeba castellanii str. Neff]
MVRPYWFQYRARAKGHWVGQPLIRILTSHFHRHPPAYYLEAVETGRVKVNQQRAAPDQLFAATDLLHHDMHIHEPAVTSEPVQIIHSSDELVVVNKPAGLPCHEVSLYKYNTLSAILRLEMNARKLHMAIMTGQVGKFYIARAETGVSLVDYEKGRTAHTIFEHAGYDSATDTSLVKCNPTTGRRHQIRAHLNHLGFPIANDLLYGQGPLVRSRAEFLKLQQGSAEDWSQMSPEELTAFKESQPGMLPTHSRNRYRGDGWHFTAPLPSWAQA